MNGNVDEINPDWLMFEIAKLNSRSFVNLSKGAIEALIKQAEDRIKQFVLTKNHEIIANGSQLDIRNLYAQCKSTENVVDSIINKMAVQIECNEMLHRKIEKLEKEMTKLTTKARKALPAAKFAEPKERKYPVDTKARAVNAKARATQMVEKGKLSESSKEKIDKKANKVLKKKK